MGHNIHNFWYDEEHCSLDVFRRLVMQEVNKDQYSYAASIEKKIPVYNSPDLVAVLHDVDRRRELQAEWGTIFQQGPGVIVLKHAFQDTTPIDEASAVFDAIVAEERKKQGGGADHFAKGGSNDRVWNSLEKLCIQAPKVFARYFGNEMIAAASEAWLGPNYQMTSQMNSVRPGGAAQQPHRDYHLGFQTEEAVKSYPSHVHLFSPQLTLQGGVAHCDMPIESGPTKLLPFSQIYPEGYLAYRREDFRKFYEENYVQLPLEKGDLIFFNPALFHSAGNNVTKDVVRMVNLLQVSSALARAMESINRLAMSESLYPVLQTMVKEKSISNEQVASALAACAEGYSFPTNLDTDPPAGALAPETQHDIFRKAMKEGWSAESFSLALREQAQKKGGHL